MQNTPKKAAGLTGRQATDAERAQHLLRRTTATSSGCLEFTGCVQSNGYARATVRRKTDYAHRHIFRLCKGDIPAGMDVCHQCDNRRCINPDHLFAGTRQENMADAVSKGRQARGFMLPHTKVSRFVEEEITRLAKAGVPYKQVSALFGICRQHVGQVAIRNGVNRNGITK